nr:lysylphosphatidylglycerol synthase domain-containing protein [Sphingomonas sp. GC_Shp_6]
MILIATLIGLAVAIWAFAATGFDGIVHVVARMGLSGLLLYCGYSACVFVILGAAWLAAAPGEPAAKLGLFAWGRAVREAVADLLPFSQIGGIVVGARTIAGGDVPLYRVYASLIVDMTTELASQLAFTLFGVATVVSLLAAGPDADRLKPLLLAGVAVLAAIVLALFGAQRLLLRIAAGLAQRVLPGSAATIEAIGGELTRIYAHRGRVALALALNLAAWIASAGGAWLVLRLMGVMLPLGTVLAIEALIFTLRSVAFAIPGGIGVQEAAYALVGPALGLPPDAALALALAKRGRDVALGIPTLLLWQAGTMRRLVRG